MQLRGLPSCPYQPGVTEQADKTGTEWQQDGLQTEAVPAGLLRSLSQAVFCPLPWRECLCRQGVIAAQLPVRCACGLVYAAALLVFTALIISSPIACRTRQVSTRGTSRLMPTAALTLMQQAVPSAR